MKLRVGYGRLRNAEVSLWLCSLLVGFSIEPSGPDVRGASSPDGLGGEGGGVGGLGRVGIGAGEGGLSESGRNWNRIRNFRHLVLCAVGQGRLAYT